jgi:hypothetical protein
MKDVSNYVVLRAAKKFSSYSTCIQWNQLFNETGGTYPLRHASSHQREREIQGTDLKQLALNSAFFDGHYSQVWGLLIQY